MTLGFCFLKSCNSGSSCQSEMYFLLSTKVNAAEDHGKNYIKVKLSQALQLLLSLIYWVAFLQANSLGEILHTCSNYSLKKCDAG